MTALEFLARWVDHVPERYETRVPYYGAFATRRRFWWRRRGIVLENAPQAEPERFVGGVSCGTLLPESVTDVGGVQSVSPG